MTGRSVTDSLEKKVLATIERTEHLVSVIPEARLDWRPEMSGQSAPTSDAGLLLGHLLDCMAGFCAAFYAAFPDELENLAELKSATVNHFCGPEEWRKRVRVYRQAIEHSFLVCNDQDLARPVKTIFNPEGESLATLLLSNLEHLLNHKYQLFFYLKLMSVPVGTEDLYDLRRKL
jgi:hypothetical protein